MYEQRWAEVAIPCEDLKICRLIQEYWDAKEFGQAEDKEIKATEFSITYFEWVLRSKWFEAYLNLVVIVNELSQT